MTAAEESTHSHSHQACCQRHPPVMVAVKWLLLFSNQHSLMQDHLTSLHAELMCLLLCHMLFLTLPDLLCMVRLCCQRPMHIIRVIYHSSITHVSSFRVRCIQFSVAPCMRSCFGIRVLQSAICKIAKGTVGCRRRSSIQLLRSPMMMLALVMIQAMFSGTWTMGKHTSRPIPEG